MISWSLNAASLGLLRGRACTSAHGFCFVSFIANRRVAAGMPQPRFARPQRGGVAGGVVALDIRLPAGARGPPPATGSSSSSNFTLAYLRQSAFSCPRAPGASCSERKVSRITWTSSFLPQFHKPLTINNLMSIETTLFFSN